MSIVNQISAALPLLRPPELRAALAELVLRTHVIPVAISDEQYFCIGGFYVYAAAKRMPRNTRVRVMVYEGVSDKIARAICLSYLASELLCLVKFGPRYTSVLWKNLDVEDRSRLFPGISTRRSMARAMDVSYATAFPTEKQLKSEIDSDEQGDLDFGIQNNDEKGGGHDDT